MHISSKKRRLLRKYERALFFSDYAKKDKRYVFFLLLLPIVEWLKPKMKEYGLEGPEIMSELFLLSVRVFNDFNKEKSSIIPYLRRQLPWSIKDMFDRLERNYPRKTSIEQGAEDKSYCIDEEFYWEKILFEDRWVGKCFTRSEKYLIHILVTSDRDVSYKKLAKETNMERHTLKARLHDIQEILEGIYG